MADPSKLLIARCRAVHGLHCDLNADPEWNNIFDRYHKCVPEKQDLYQLPLSNLKHLIFVRRIPSVRELTQRLNERYDQLLGEILFSGLGLSFLDTQGNPRLKTFSRNEFEQLLESTRAGVSQDESMRL